MTTQHTIYFDRKKIVFLPKNIKTKNNELSHIMDSLNWDQFISFTKDDIRVLHCLSDDPAMSFNSFKAYFQLLKAAGGLVVNDCGHWLFIYRNDRWDLPKGLVEAGENAAGSAIREVREECGITDIKIIKALPATYHVYPTERGRWAIKETQWYLMKALKNEALKPQTEEGITVTTWRNPKKLNDIKENTYGSIKELIEYCL